MRGSKSLRKRNCTDLPNFQHECSCPLGYSGENCETTRRLEERRLQSSCNLTQAVKIS